MLKLLNTLLHFFWHLHVESIILFSSASELATGPQCGGCWGRAVWLQASGADGRHSVLPRTRPQHMTACFCQQGDLDTINNNYDFLLQFLMR